MAGSPQASRPDTVRHSPRLGPAADPNPQKRSGAAGRHDGAAALQTFASPPQFQLRVALGDGSPSSKRGGGRRREPLAGGSASPLAPRDSRPAPASAPAAACAGAASSSLGRAVRPPPIGRAPASTRTARSTTATSRRCRCAPAPPRWRRRRRATAAAGGGAAARANVAGAPRRASAARSARSLEMLQARGVTHVLNCCTLPNFHEGAADGPEYLRLDCSTRSPTCRG